MLKQEFVQRVAFKMGATKKIANMAVEAVLDSVVDALIETGEITFKGFGKFEVLEKKARKGRNPRTGEVISIKERKSPKFKAGKFFKESIEEGKFIKE